MEVFELNLDGLVGPTHHYAGLATGNLASTKNALTASNPQAAARQGLKKMRLLHEMGLKQGLLPPHQRPNLQLLYALGFTGTASQQIAKAYQYAPECLSACYSAASMWTANAATVSSSLESADERVHFTAANLISNLHRCQEAAFSKFLLERVFSHERYFAHHPVLPASLMTTDEGAANHSRLCERYNQPGINLFVYGKRGQANTPKPEKYPARQTFEASQAIARAHLLNWNKVIFACQNPQAIDAGVFHNDVIAVANENLLLVHEDAFLEQSDVIKELQRKAHFPLKIMEVPAARLSLAEAVESYLFNSQLLTLTDGTMCLVAPTECQENNTVKTLIDEWLSDSAIPIDHVHFLDLRQSMRNGGGPACLRLRVPLNEAELAAMHQPILINTDLLNQLDAWILRHYRTELTATDLADPALMNEAFTALDELTQLLQLPSLYPFQRE